MATAKLVSRADGLGLDYYLAAVAQHLKRLGRFLSPPNTPILDHNLVER